LVYGIAASGVKRVAASAIAATEEREARH